MKNQSLKTWIVLFFVLIYTYFGIMIYYNFSNNKIMNIENKEEENYLAIYLEDEQINYFPNRESGYTLDLTKSKCNHGVDIFFDYNTWSIITNYSNYENTDSTRVKCDVYFTNKYIEPLLNGTDPILKEPLIPVVISDDGIVRKADLASEWYKYETKKWANAVILEDESKHYASNEIIPEENIASYFVWIPKYRYQLWDLGLYDSLTSIDANKVHKIPVIFGDYSTSDSVSGECSTPMESGATGNCKVGDYMTHPAFLSIPSTGFWAGKFSTGYRGATSQDEARQNVYSSDKLIIKPNVYSWTGLQLANAHLNGYHYQRILDSHVMKNTEWGAVAYLSHSAYGIQNSIRLNNHSFHITGYQANDEPTCGYTGTNESCNRFCYDNTCNTAYPNSNLASTTGNITGVFDMSGIHTKVMGIMADETGAPVSGIRSDFHSGFNGKYTKPNSGETNLTTGINYPDKKYYDLYSFSENNSSFYRRILGDATGEMGPVMEVINLNDWLFWNSSWYDDTIGQFCTTTYSFANRSYAAAGGINSGAFAFQGDYGTPAGSSYRVILTPTD